MRVWRGARKLDTNEAMSPEPSVILLTGATGYIGGRLLRLLEKQGYRVRGLARRPEVLREKAGALTEVVAGDLLDRSSLDTALRGVDAAYYLVHSMVSDGSFEESDRTAASNFGQAANGAGVRRIIYLGWTGQRRGRTLAAPPQPTRGGTNSARVRRAGTRVPRVRRDRLGKPIVRDDSVAGGAASDHDHAQVGQGNGAAHRHQRPAGIFVGRASPAVSE